MSVMDQRGAKFFGESCGKHGMYTFYPGLEYNSNGRVHHLMLGNFFNISIKSPNENGACLDLVGELQLVWHDKNHDDEKLSSLKLYARPECCPGGRQAHHGQDEILAEETKVVIRISQLVELVISSSQIQRSGSRSRAVLSSPENGGKCVEVRRPLIMSYPRYCRYKACLKRLENVEQKLHNEILIYLLGRSFMQNLPCEEKDIYFCRETTTLPDLKHFKDELSHLAPRLKGRKRKKKQSLKSFDSDDSNESEVCSDHVVLRKNHRSSIDFAVLNGRSLSYKRRKVVAEDDFTKDKESFLKMLHHFMEENHSPIYRSPTLGFKEVDLHQFYVSTKKRGGYKEVTKKKLWKEIYDELGGSSCNTSAATGTRKNYEKFLQPFENFLDGRESRTSSQKCYKSKKSPSSSKSSAKQNPQSTTKSGSDANADPLVVVKPVEGSIVQKSGKASPTIPNPRSEVSVPISRELTLPSNSVGKCSSSEEAQDLLVPSSSDFEPEIPPCFAFSAASNLSTVSQKLLAGGQALLNVKDEAAERKATDSSDRPLLPSARDDKTLKTMFALTSSPMVPKDFLSTVLSSSSSLNLLAGRVGSFGSRSSRGTSNSRSRFERFCVEDLCTRGKMKNLSSVTKTVKNEFEQLDDVPLDYSMKTLRLYEASSTRCKLEQPLDLSMKKFNESHSENSRTKSCCSESQTPLDLSKSSMHRKDDGQHASLPINLAQLLPLAFAMPLSSTLQALPRVLSPIQQNINMIYNPGSVNFPIISFPPPSTDILSSFR